MSAQDYIQLCILATLLATAGIGVFQLVAHNRLLKANVLAARLQTYWMTIDPPLTQGHADEVALYPDEYMDPATFEARYRNDPTALKRYVGILMMYEYLAFVDSLRVLRIPDPVGYNWVSQWTEDLCRHQEFRDVNDWHRSYYPHYAALVDAILEQKIPPETRSVKTT